LDEGDAGLQFFIFAGLVLADAVQGFAGGVAVFLEGLEDERGKGTQSGRFGGRSGEEGGQPSIPVFPNSNDYPPPLGAATENHLMFIFFLFVVSKISFCTAFWRGAAAFVSFTV